jgi:hypothetical protein
MTRQDYSSASYFVCIDAAGSYGEECVGAYLEHLSLLDIGASSYSKHGGQQTSKNRGQAYKARTQSASLWTKECSYPH